MRSWNTPATIRPSASTTCTCTRTIRSARSSGTRSTSTRRSSPGAPATTPLTEATCKVPRGPDRTWPALDREGMFRAPSAAVVFGDVALPWYVRQGDQPLASSRGHVYDHIALSVADLDAWVAKLRERGRHVPRRALHARRHARGDDRGAEPRSAGAGRDRVRRPDRPTGCRARPCIRPSAPSAT